MLLVCYVLLYVVALCVKMRYVILCIKRLLTDWLGPCNGRMSVHLSACLSRRSTAAAAAAAGGFAAKRHAYTLNRPDLRPDVGDKTKKK